MNRITPTARSRKLFSKLLILGLLATASSCIPDFLVKNPDWVEIDKDAHDPALKRKGGLLISPREISATVKFDSTCMYDITQVDEFDYNKVFGF